ncbi:hypothetical protein [Reinekea thalattae]|uniref:PilN domain-containing protein n=1 Tax=Reinekea thalattae TaxID=2593301 RepID=A0A5C8ZBV3_9GAMM|nr:hypothetical protein [Reinekea thalattae]TXR54300.1 hypothetical protein FME95_07125 [Reinekea thalattae]
MTHQVNLWRNQKLTGYGPLQLEHFLLVIAAAVISAILWFTYNLINYHQTLNEIDYWSEQAENSLAQLRKFQKDNPNVGDEAQLQALNQLYSQRLQQARDIHLGLSYSGGDSVEGFTLPLGYLTDHDIEGLWLNKIYLQDSYRVYRLEGYARAPELIATYIEGLKDSVFQGLSIDQLSVRQHPEQQSLWMFSIGNTVNPNSEEDDSDLEQLLAPNAANSNSALGESSLWQLVVDQKDDNTENSEESY